MNNTIQNSHPDLNTVIPKINIGGTGISDITLAETMNLFDKWIEQKEQKRICVTPVNCIVWANQGSTASRAL